MAPEEFCGPGKYPAPIQAKEAMILVGRRMGATVAMLSQAMRLSSATVSRRYDAARRKLRADPELQQLVTQIERAYQVR